VLISRFFVIDEELNANDFEDNKWEPLKELGLTRSFDTLEMAFHTEALEWCFGDTIPRETKVIAFRYYFNNFYLLCWKEFCTSANIELPDLEPKLLKLLDRKLMKFLFSALHLRVNLPATQPKQYFHPPKALKKILIGT
jgi:hypothetical protein